MLTYWIGPMKAHHPLSTQRGRDTVRSGRARRTTCGGIETAEQEVAPRRSQRLRAQRSNVHSLPRAALQQEVTVTNINSDMLDTLCQSHLILMKLAAGLNP